jgi:hypothetical protein
MNEREHLNHTISPNLDHELIKNVFYDKNVLHYPYYGYEIMQYSQLSIKYRLII